MSRVLVTGASGFVGRALTTQLVRDGHEVHALSRRTAGESAELAWHSGDLLEPRTADRVVRAVRPTELVHLAWYAEPGRFWAAQENAEWVTASTRLLATFAEQGGERAVLAGSCAEYRWDDRELDEGKSPLEPATFYGECKRAAHLEAEAVAGRHGVSLAWARIFFLYGPGESRGRLVSDVAAKLVSGDRVETTEGAQRRDFLHVQDVASAFAAVLRSGVTGPVNVCSGEAPTIREVVTRIAVAANALDRVDFGALPMREGDPAVIVGRNHRLRSEAGFAPAIGLDPGLAETVAWWREQGGAAAA